MIRPPNSGPLGKWKLLATFQAQDDALTFVAERTSEIPVYIGEVHIPPLEPRWNVYELTGHPWVERRTMSRKSTGATPDFHSGDSGFESRPGHKVDS